MVLEKMLKKIQNTIFKNILLHTDVYMYYRKFYKPEPDKTTVFNYKWLLGQMIGLQPHGFLCLQLL